MRSYLILAMCGLFLFQYFARLPWLDNVLFVITLAAFAGSVPKAAPLARWFGLSMLITGIAIELYKGGGIAAIRSSIAMNLPLLTLMVLVPLLALPLKLGGYFSAIDILLRRLKHKPRRLFAGITGVLFILGPILNLGSMRVMDELLNEHKLPRALLAKGYTVGFTTTMLWSPYYASVALVLFYLQIKTSAYMAYGIGFALFFLLSGNAVFALQARKLGPLSDHGVEEDRLSKEEAASYRSKLLQLAIIVVALMSFTFILEHWTHWSMLVIVSLIALAFPLLWAVAAKGWSRLVPNLISFRDHSVPVMNNEILLYPSAALLGAALKDTSFGNGIKWMLNSLAQHSFYLFTLSVLIIIVVITFIGVHPMATVTTLVTQMDAQQLGTSNLVLAVLLMLSWSIASAVSPVNPMNLLVSRLTGSTGIEAGLRYNGLHLLIVAVAGTCLITWIH